MHGGLEVGAVRLLLQGNENVIIAFHQLSHSRHKVRRVRGHAFAEDDLRSVGLGIINNIVHHVGQIRTIDDGNFQLVGGLAKIVFADISSAVRNRLAEIRNGSANAEEVIRFILRQVSSPVQGEIQHFHLVAHG